MHRERARGVLLAALLVLSLWGCGPSFELCLESIPVKRDSTTTRNAGESVRVSSSDYTFSSDLEITNIEIHDSLALALISFHRSYGRSGHLMYDLDADSVRWCVQTGMSFEVMSYNNLVLKNEQGLQLFDALTGRFIRQAEPFLYFLDAKTTLMMRPDTFAVIDVLSGERSWRAKGHKWKGGMEVIRRDSVTLYVIAEGIHVLNLKIGKQWEYLTSTSSTNVGAGIMRGLMSSMIFGPGGGSGYDPDVTTNMNSRPLFDGDDVYFAARDKIVRLDQGTGKVIWEVEIEPELKGMVLTELSATELLLMGSGTKMMSGPPSFFSPLGAPHNLAPVMHNPPVVRIISKATGTVRKSFEWNYPAIVHSIVVSGEKIYVITAAQVMVLDSNLKRLAGIIAKAEYGSFSSLLSLSGDTLILRSSKGIVALDAASNKEIWFRYSEVPPVLGVDPLVAPWYENVRIRFTSFWRAGYYWTVNENGGLSVFDLTQGKQLLAVPLLGKTLLRFRESFAVDFDKNHMRILRFE